MRRVDCAGYQRCYKTAADKQAGLRCEGCPYYRRAWPVDLTEEYVEACWLMVIAAYVCEECMRVSCEPMGACPYCGKDWRGFFPQFAFMYRKEE